MPFLLPNQQRQSTEGKSTESKNIIINLKFNLLFLAHLVEHTGKHMK